MTAAILVEKPAVARWLTVIGVGENGSASLTGEALRALQEAELVVGGARHLALLPAHLAPAAERRAWPSPMLP
ncbi:cobalamin biosynthesis bifunctional protein CbiET, partial [Hansschlegelia beijingensis]